MTDMIGHGQQHCTYMAFLKGLISSQTWIRITAASSRDHITKLHINTSQYLGLEAKQDKAEKWYNDAIFMRQLAPIIVLQLVV